MSSRADGKLVSFLLLIGSAIAAANRKRRIMKIDIRMNVPDLQHKETLLLETLLLSLDARENARQAGTPLLSYVAELLVQRTRDELDIVRKSIEAAERAENDKAP